MKTVGFIHTALILVEVIKKELKDLSVEVNAFHMVDESLLIDLMKEGRLHPGIIRRLCQHVVSAEEAGADMITVTCSSISPTVDIARRLVSRPVLKIDEPMAEKAVKSGEKIGIVATVATTLDPTSSLLGKKAEELGKKISVSTALCQEAFKAILQGDTEKHDRMVTEEAVRLAREVDVIVLAQGSMARLRSPLSQQVNIPVLASPPLFAEMLKSMLQGFGG
ncbi:MAG: aspartate/glutamate racemase family protein [Thermodesulfobacteriota bacterium]|nr:aspartate/glutamate racemase family protein [Thermodesulfobacteriota bacterium]